ncbi:uncharacterized protein phf11 isoform X2 [Pimephales promelas]|uniref:uncharacterized protein phf11 isoform X2 n=1 Tax=Pimephales promelas TaxID=90988 RepID=UPI001955CE44|nr:uncharacterized protein phf11 isoform X2 [Pimephales promelas]
MVSDQYPCKIICVLCEKSDEDEITGPLSSKEKISAHQNCLLFASGIYCKNSPTYDDLFGFAVEDVIEERRRGKKLTCHHCKKRGATAGCDLKRCKHSYHYPCAIEARARAIENYDEGTYKLYCETHDPDLKETSLVSLQGASTSGLSGSKRRRSADSHGPRPDRGESNSSTGSEASLSRKKNKEDVDPVFAPVESDEEECTPPKQHNQSTPDPKCEGPRKELSPSVTGSLNRALTSDQKASGSANNLGDLHGSSVSYSQTWLPEVETPRRKKIKFLQYLDDDESPNDTDPVAVPVVIDLEKPNSPPVPEKPPKNHFVCRPCEKLNPSTTGADDSDTDIDSEDSQSLLPSKMNHTTVPFTIIIDSGPSAESEYSLELGSPAPEAVCSSPGFVAAPEHEETPSTIRTSQVPKAPTDTVSPGIATPEQHHDSKGQPGSSRHSRPDFNIEDLPEPSPAGVSTLLDRATTSDACDVNGTRSTQSNAVIFWTRCNQAGWTEKIFSELVSQLESLGERVHSQEASHQDYDVALKLLEVSGRLPCIITQLEQDLEEQERDLQRKKAALRDARAALGLI